MLESRLAAGVGVVVLALVLSWLAATPRTLASEPACPLPPQESLEGFELVEGLPPIDQRPTGPTQTATFALG